MRGIQHTNAHFDSGCRNTFRINRSGGATSIGGVYVCDTKFSEMDAATTDYKTMYDNVVKPTTANIAGRPFALVAKAVIADDARGPFLQGDAEGVICQALVLGASGTKIGDKLKLVNGQVYMSKATTGTDTYNAELLETWETASSALKLVRFFSQSKF